ncbi:MAG TPA: hypothetical protein DGG95_14375, partial [Cytophagales bacterium]|nr:hypothetical protein [Cytophagales bacterium]
MNGLSIVQILFLAFALTSASVVFSQPTFTISNKKDACNGLQNGSFDITVSAGTGTVSAFVFNAGHSPNPIGPISLTVGVPTSVTGLVGTGAGNSTLVVVSDDNGSSSSSVTIFLRSNVSVSLVSKTDVTTCSPYNGAISISASGGSSSYTFSWSGPSGFTDPGTQNISAIGPGDYTVTVNDANTACSASLGPITINIGSPSITLGSIPGVCSGTTSSTLPYSATTGSPDQYTIDWDNTANSAGLADVAYTALPASPIPISGIPTV